MRNLEGMVFLVEFDLSSLVIGSSELVVKMKAVRLCNRIHLLLIIIFYEPFKTRA